MSRLMTLKKVKVGLTLCNPMDYSPPDSSVHGIFQARTLEWVAIYYSRVSSDPGIKPSLLHWQAEFFTTVPPGKPEHVHTHRHTHERTTQAKAPGN